MPFMRSWSCCCCSCCCGDAGGGVCCTCCCCCSRADGGSAGGRRDVVGPEDEGGYSRGSWKDGGAGKFELFIVLLALCAWGQRQLSGGWTKLRTILPTGAWVGSAAGVRRLKRLIAANVCEQMRQVYRFGDVRRDTLWCFARLRMMPTEMRALLGHLLLPPRLSFPRGQLPRLYFRAIVPPPVRCHILPKQ
jgi:hypothetical protein